MIRCCVCSGQHHALNCVIARRYIDECHSGTPDDVVQPIAAARNVWSLDDYREELRVRRNAAQRPRSARYRAIRAARLG